MNIVEKKARKILIGGIETLSISEKTNDVQYLVKYFNGQPEFFGMREWKTELGHIPISSVYPVWKDLFGITPQIPIFLANLINEISEEKNIAETDLKLILSIFEPKPRKKDISVTAYSNDGKIIKNMQFAEVFGEAAMVKMMAK